LLIATQWPALEPFDLELRASFGDAPAGGAGGNDRKPRQRCLVGPGEIGQIILLLVMRDQCNGFVNSHGGPSSEKPREDRGLDTFNRFDTPIYIPYPDQTKATAAMNFR
jgi:hypothetical protein